jgi:hypothetical protein
MLFQSFGSHSNGTVPSDDDNRCRPRSDSKRLDEDGCCRPEKQNAKRCELAHGCGSPLSLTHFPYYSFALYSMWRRVEDNPSPFAHRYPRNLPRVTKILRKKILNKNDMSISYLFHHSGTSCSTRSANPNKGAVQSVLLCVCVSQDHSRPVVHSHRRCRRRRSQQRRLVSCPCRGSSSPESKAPPPQRRRRRRRVDNNNNNCALHVVAIGAESSRRAADPSVLRYWSKVRTILFVKRWYARS